MREWWFERNMLAAQGVKADDLDRFDDIMQDAAQAYRPKRPATRAERSREIAAFVAAATQ